MDSNKKRLKALKSLRLLDIPPGEGLKRIVDMVAMEFDTSMAAITLADKDMRHIYATKEDRDHQVYRCKALCAALLDADDVVIVEDTSKDYRFKQLWQSAGTGFIAAAPLMAGPDIKLGGLIVADPEPRTPRMREVEMLRHLAATAVDEIHLHVNISQLDRDSRLKKRQRDTLRQRNKDIARREKEMSIAAKLAKVGSWSLDLRNDRVTWSQQMRIIHQVADDYRPTLESALQFYDPRAQDEIKIWLKAALETGEPFRFELPITTAKGNRRWLSSMGEVEMENGQAIRINGCLQDVTDRREAENEISRLATQDSLTALPNRKVFRESLAAALERAKEKNKVAGLLIVDLDHFKAVNDTHGHDVGDNVLRAIAEAISVNVRKSDTVARLGGDEFAVVLNSCTRQADVEQIGERLTDACASLENINEDLPNISVTIGAAVAPRDGGTVDEIFKAADIALYTAKSAGRARLAWYEPAMGLRFSQKQSTLAAIREAIEKKEITAVYQPKIRFSDMSICGAEALARWDHREKGLLPPGTFIDAFDDPRLAAEISRAVLKTVISDAKLNAISLLLNGPIAFNVTEAQINDPSFADDLLMTLEDAELAPDTVMVEVTEDVFLGNKDACVLNNMKRLREAGIPIALDDFGTGFASLSHLMKFPVDRLKVDRSFIINLDSDEQSRIITSAVIKMAHGLGMEVVAEGIESPGAEAFLLELGCDYGQGFHYALPMRAEKLLASLENGEAMDNTAAQDFDKRHMA